MASKREQGEGEWWKHTGFPRGWNIPSHSSLLPFVMDSYQSENPVEHRDGGTICPRCKGGKLDLWRFGGVRIYTEYEVLYDESIEDESERKKTAYSKRHVRGINTCYLLCANCHPDRQEYVKREQEEDGTLLPLLSLSTEMREGKLFARWTHIPLAPSASSK